MRQNDFLSPAERQRLPIPLYPPAANPPPSKRVFKVTSRGLDEEVQEEEEEEEEEDEQDEEVSRGRGCSGNRRRRENTAGGARSRIGRCFKTLNINTRGG